MSNKKFAWSTRRVAKSPFRSLNRAKQVETAYKKGKSVGFTAKSSLKSMRRIPRANGSYTLGDKYKNL